MHTDTASSLIVGRHKWKMSGFKTSSNNGKATLTGPFPSGAMEFTHAVTISGNTTIFFFCIHRLPLPSTQLPAFFHVLPSQLQVSRKTFWALISVKVPTEVTYLKGRGIPSFYVKSFPTGSFSMQVTHSNISLWKMRGFLVEKKTDGQWNRGVIKLRCPSNIIKLQVAANKAQKGSEKVT